MVSPVPWGLDVIHITVWAVRHLKRKRSKKMQSGQERLVEIGLKFLKRLRCTATLTFSSRPPDETQMVKLLPMEPQQMELWWDTTVLKIPV